MPPWATFSPLECSEGVSPSHAANDLAFRNLANSPASKTMSAAVMTSMPFRHRRESTLFFHLGLDKMGSKEAGEMQFWTKDEYLRFSEAISGKPLAFYAFEVLYWMGVRCGELMALTPSDFLMETSELRINKSYQRLRGEDVVTKPKTRKSVRTIKMPAFLRDEMAEFIEMRDDVAPDERLFGLTKHFLVHEMDRGCKASGVKWIRIHDLRHSHVNLLINMGFSALDIAERVGHEAIDITYRYAHLFPAKRAQIADALSELRGE